MNAAEALNSSIDLVCFSHLRWGFVFQRPQHLMSRFARDRRVFFIEEPLFENVAEPSAQLRVCDQTGVNVVTPVLPDAVDRARTPTTVSSLVKKFMRDQ